MTRRRLALLPIALLGVAAGPFLPWEDMTETDWIYGLATRFATVDGHRVHYPTPTSELAAALESRSEPAALRHLAEARMELGDRASAIAALEKWAEAEGPLAWAEAANWGANHSEWALAFRAAERALSGLSGIEAAALARRQVAWADAHPDSADPIALRRKRAETFPKDSEALEDLIRALERSKRLDEAEAALKAAAALPAERRVLLRSDLLADHDQPARAFEVLDNALDEGPWGEAFRTAYAARTDQGKPGAPEAWRGTLERSFDAGALLRLATYFEGQRRGDAASELLQQVERRYEKGLDRRGWLLLSRLYEEIDSIPEAFRARLAASAKDSDPNSDLGPLALLALKAGGRPLPWGAYNDEPYRWLARIDRTPGFWTGGLSFLLTGGDWKEALSHLEAESLPDRTFETARILVDELARRAPSDPRLPPLRVAIMERYVERGEGKAALSLLPGLEAGSPEVAAEAERIALLALRQVEGPLGEELRLYRSRIKRLAPDGSRPQMTPGGAGLGNLEESGVPTGETGAKSWSVGGGEKASGYKEVLDEALTRIEERDLSHKTGLDLLLGEMDRLKEAEELWTYLAARLERWNLDDELGPRYEQALQRFSGPGWWPALARWYARRSREQDLAKLASDLVARFRAAEVFQRSGIDSTLTLSVPEQPPVGSRVRLVLWADFVRLKALERFPHSPAVMKQARERLMTQSEWKDELKHGTGRLTQQAHHKPVVNDSLFEERRWALIFVDPFERNAFFEEAMAAGALEKRLVQMESDPEKNPVEDQILFEGWCRLSRFERAVPAADRLAASYPGNPEIAQRALSLHRSLASLDPSMADPARAIVARTAPALTNPGALWTELGEMEEERGHPEDAQQAWRKILEPDPRNPKRILELATILWDYSHAGEAMGVIRQGRERLGQKQLLAFEAGVLKEELKDREGAITEYLTALNTKDDGGFFPTCDARALRRLGQLMGRGRVLGIVLDGIVGLRPGVLSDEGRLAQFFPLAGLSPGEPSWADDWMDFADLPRDPVGRAERAAARAEAAPGERTGMSRLRQAILAKALEMIPRATRPEFLDALENASGLSEHLDATMEVTFHSTIMARRAELAPTPEDRVGREVERARYLVEHKRREEADEIWARLGKGIASLPEGAPRMHAEAEEANHIERTKGPEEAAAAWARLSARYPWSLGLLEDHLAFLARVGRAEEARAVLEAAVPRAAAGHRERLLFRLAKEALEAGDLPRARRATEGLLSTAKLEDEQRIEGLQLIVRLRLREDSSFDAVALGKAEAPKIKDELHGALYASLARAADLENASPQAYALWLEALNRRLERDWLKEACRSAERSGRGAALLDFFDRQQKRSTRDVRWAVAVREIKLFGHDLEGAIEMAKAAVAIRPEREALWRDVVDLLVRAGRPREAADFLEEWNKPRASDESVAHWRSGLYIRAQDLEKALLIERTALAAFAREGPLKDERKKEHEARTSRAAQHLVESGEPGLAFRLVCPDGDVRRLAASPLGARGRAELALMTGHTVALLRLLSREDDLRETLAAVRDNGRPEQKEEVESFIVGQILRGPVAGVDGAALSKWWKLASDGGFERMLRTAIARRFLAQTLGPWQTSSSASFVEEVGREALRSTPSNDESKVEFKAPDLEALWFRDLVRRDRIEELGAFIGPRWQDLLVRVRSDAALAASPERLPWAPWLDDAMAFGAFTRFLAARPERIADVAPLLTERKRWDRFWALAARGWDVAPLVSILPEDNRTAWFRLWQVPSPLDPDPILKARGQSLESVGLALGRLVSGAPGAAADPLLVKLRGPRTIGGVLGKDPAWVFSEFSPRRSAKGEILESAEDRWNGQGADEGRFPGALWGERPGEAWFVLEALAGLREHQAPTAFVPLEVPHRGRESERALLAIRLAEALEEPALAEQLNESYRPSSRDLLSLEVRLRPMLRSGKVDKAKVLFQAEVRRRQASLNEEGFRGLQRLAEDLSVGEVVSLMDPETPLNPSLLAFLYDKKGLARGSAFRTPDIVDFRAALAARWSNRIPLLSAEDVHFYLSELWAQGAAPLPRVGLKKLGGIWADAGDWLDKQPVIQRGEALTALGELPQKTRLEAMLEGEAGKDETARLLRVRLHLAAQDDGTALALLDDMLREVKTAAPLHFRISRPSQPDESEETDTDWGQTPKSEDSVVTRLRAWLLPFQEVKRGAEAEKRVRDALRERLETGREPGDSWVLALELSGSPGEQSALLQNLEYAFIRGDLSPDELPVLLEALAKRDPAEARRWLGRWPNNFAFGSVATRAEILRRMGDKSGAAQTLVEARRHKLWAAVDEVKAFDLWRGLAPGGPQKAAAAPPSWVAALPYWRSKPGDLARSLAQHLLGHPRDILAARSVLRTAAPGEEEPLRLALLTLDDPALQSLGKTEADAAFLQLRIARSLLASSWRGAAVALASFDETRSEDLQSRRMPKADVLSALSDVGRIATRAKDARSLEAALTAIEDLSPEVGRKLRAELKELQRPEGPPRNFRYASGKLAAYRPRDLDWSVLDAVLAWEVAR